MSPDTKSPVGEGSATLTFPVERMTCAACASRVQRRLSKGPGVRAAAVNFGTERATVSFHPGSVDAAGIAAIVADAGYGARAVDVVLHVDGLEWSATAAGLERALREVPGVIAASGNVARGEVAVRYLDEAVTASDLEAAVRRAGYRLAEPLVTADPVERERAYREREYRRLRARLGVAAVSAALSMLLSMPLMLHATMGPADLLDRLMMPVAEVIVGAFPLLDAASPSLLRWVLLLVTLPALVYSGRSFYRAAWSGVLRGSADMNTLIAVGTGAAFGWSLLATAAPGLFERAGLPADVYYEAVAFIIALVLLG